MLDEKNENIENLPENFINDEEEEMKPIPGILDDEEEFNIENNDKKENLDFEKKENFSKASNSNEEINNINLNLENINDNDNDNYAKKNEPMKNNFFLTNPIDKIDNNNSESKEKNNNNQENNNLEEFEGEKEGGEEDEFDKIDEIEQISDLEGEEEDINKSKGNNQESSNRLLGIKSNLKKVDNLNDDSLDLSFHSLSSSLNENIENKIGEIIETDDKVNSFMKQMLVETNKHYIKEQRQQSEKLQEWGLKVILNILLGNKNRIVQNAFYIIKFSRISLSKNREKIFFKDYQKYRLKAQNEFIKKNFIKFKIKSIELKPREERILDLIKGIKANLNNIENIQKIEKLISEKINIFNELKKEEEEKNKKEQEEITKSEDNKMETKEESHEQQILENKENEENEKVNQILEAKKENKNIEQKEEIKEDKKVLRNIDNNESEPEKNINLSIPSSSSLSGVNILKPPISSMPGVPPPPGVLPPDPPGVPPPPGVPLPPGLPGVPPPPEVPLPPGPPGIPSPPGLGMVNLIPDPTKNIPKPPKGFISRKFQWQKVDFSNYEKSFWKEMEEEQEKTKNPLKIDFDSLQKIFTYEKVSKKEQSKKGNEKQKKKEEKITILDSKRLMNMSISLSKIKISIDKFESLIKAYDIDNILDMETLKTILSFFPNDDEKKALLSYNDDIQKLSYPDKFCRMLVSIENCQKILNILLFKKQLSGKISNMLLQIKVLKETVISINNSEQFKSVLFILRQIGNYLNTGTNNGKALGFNINSLSKLDSIKGINKEKTSLLETLTLIIKKDNSGLINFYKDFKKLEESKNCFKDEIDKTVVELKTMINKILKEKETNNEDYLVFINSVEQYTSAKMDCLELSLQFLNDEIDKTILIFGENKSKFNINEFIKNISNFVDKYKLCSLEISKKEARILKKKISEEKKKKEITNVNADLQKICDNAIKSIAKKTNVKNGLIDKIQIDKNGVELNGEIYNIKSARGESKIIKEEKKQIVDFNQNKDQNKKDININKNKEGLNLPMTDRQKNKNSKKGK